MRLVLNSHCRDMASQVCIRELCARLQQFGHDAVLNDWDHYERYDVAVFMGYDEEMDKARCANPAIRIAIADPKQSRAVFRKAAVEADFLLVSSVEQRDVFYAYNRNVMIYYMFPEMAAVDRRHTQAETLKIGYHGNRVHLACMMENVTPALDQIGRERKAAFLAMYARHDDDYAVLGLPDSAVMPTEHISWSERNYVDALGAADVGIVPNAIPVRGRTAALRRTAYPSDAFLFEPYDFLSRYKASSNPGRIYVFAQLGIPVVADFFPSAAQFVEDGYSGILASSAAGWYEALTFLADHPDVRESMAARLRERCARMADARGLVDQFVDMARTCRRQPPLVFPPVNITRRIREAGCRRSLPAAVRKRFRKDS